MSVRFAGERMRLTVKQVAAHYGVDERTIARWITSDPPCPSEKDNGRRYFDSVAVADWREDRVRAEAESVIQSADFLEARARRMAAEASIAELKLAEMRKDLVSVDAYRL